MRKHLKMREAPRFSEWTHTDYEFLKELFLAKVRVGERCNYKRIKEIQDC
jgi:hypothetical protein